MSNEDITALIILCVYSLFAFVVVGDYFVTKHRNKKASKGVEKA